MSPEKTEEIMELIEKGQIEKVFADPKKLYQATYHPANLSPKKTKQSKVKQLLNTLRFKTGIMLLFSCLLLGRQAVYQCIKRLKNINKLIKKIT